MTSSDRSNRPPPALLDRDDGPIGIDAAGAPQPLDEEIRYCVIDGVPVKLVAIPGYEAEALAFDPRQNRLVSAPHLVLRFESTPPPLIDRAEFERLVRAAQQRR